MNKFVSTLVILGLALIATPASAFTGSSNPENILLDPCAGYETLYDSNEVRYAKDQATYHVKRLLGDDTWVDGRTLTQAVDEFISERSVITSIAETTTMDVHVLVYAVNDQGRACMTYTLEDPEVSWVGNYEPQDPF